MFGRDFGLNMTLSVHTDSACAVWICKTAGVGRVRHLAVGRCGFRKVCSRRLPSKVVDALKKHFQPDVVGTHLITMTMERVSRQAATPPKEQLKSQVQGDKANEPVHSLSATPSRRQGHIAGTHESASSGTGRRRSSTSG